MATSMLRSIASFHGLFLIAGFSFHGVGAMMAPAGVVHKQHSLRQGRHALAQAPANATAGAAATYDGAITGVCKVLEVVDGEVASTNETLTAILADANGKTQTFYNALEQARSLAQRTAMIIGQANVDKVVFFVDYLDTTLTDLWSPSADYLARSQGNLLQMYALFAAEQTKEIEAINAATDEAARACGQPVEAHADAASACQAAAAAVTNQTAMFDRTRHSHLSTRDENVQVWNPFCVFGGCKTSEAKKEQEQAAEAHNAIAAAVATTDELLSFADQANLTLDTYFTGLNQVLVNAVAQLNSTAQQALASYAQGLPSQAMKPLQSAIDAVLGLADDERAKWMQKVQQKAAAAASVRNLAAPIYSYLGELEQKVTTCETAQASPTSAPTSALTAAAVPSTTVDPLLPAAAAGAAPTAAPAAAPATTAAPATAAPAAGPISNLVVCSKWGSDVVGTAGCLEGSSCFFTEPIKPGTCSSQAVPVSTAMLGTKIAYVQPGSTRVSANTSLATLAIPSRAPTKELYAVILSEREIVIYDGCDVALPAMGVSSSSSSAGALGPLCKNSAASMLLEFSPRATATLAASMRQRTPF